LMAIITIIAIKRNMGTPNAVGADAVDSAKTITISLLSKISNIFSNMLYRSTGKYYANYSGKRGKKQEIPPELEQVSPDEVVLRRSMKQHKDTSPAFAGVNSGQAGEYGFKI
jgi:hypothetical protein